MRPLLRSVVQSSLATVRAQHKKGASATPSEPALSKSAPTSKPTPRRARHARIDRVPCGHLPQPAVPPPARRTRFGGKRALRRFFPLPCPWFPTMTLSIEFKAPIPPPSARHAARTVGLYSTGTFWGAPQGRHDAYVEIWTAPSELGEGKERGGWREERFCLVTATQMALSLPMEVNAGRAKYDAPGAEAKAKL
ncbi:hypothetical protein DFH08DRAFT_952703 [Mycena albidolilacea]|uniref:Uncharacterized protein n=1 Tax=Mycena albidolilacea TaxID=1033008 RepID=A0AAD7AIF6_9AGAR|nr:hypothetical protein DFH08DRAFT_952703 [Mycena albidolilacea]